MTDPVALAAVPVDAATAAHAGPTSPQTLFPPGDTQLFASMMQTPPPAVSLGAAAAAASPGALTDAARAVASQLSGQTRSFEDMRRGMLTSIDFSDPIKSMYLVTDASIQMQTLATRYHMGMGLATAATGLFNGLLKNQQ